MSIKEKSPTPPHISSSQKGKAKPRRIALPIMVTLALLAILVIAGVFFERSLLAGAKSISAPTPPAQKTLHVGQFVQLPLNASQLNSLRHLVDYMQYKQLARMYVSRMSLDVELGQLIMVEYSDTYYSPDLDTMINKLHAGGVIMYEFQMNTFNQTKHDIAQMQSMQRSRYSSQPTKRAAHMSIDSRTFMVIACRRPTFTIQAILPSQLNRGIRPPMI